MINIDYSKLSNETKYLIINTLSIIPFVFILLYLNYTEFIKTSTCCFCTETYLMISILYVSSIFYSFYILGIIVIINALKHIFLKTETNKDEIKLDTTILLWSLLSISIIIRLLIESTIKYEFIFLIAVPLIYLFLKFLRLRKKIKRKYGK